LSRNVLCLIAILILFCSCVSSVNVLKPNGETANLKLINSYIYECELLAVSDSSLFCKYQDKLYIVPFTNIQRVHICGYSLRPKKIIAMVPLILIDIGMASANSRENEKIQKLCWAALVPITVFAFLYNEPEVNFSPIFDKNDLEKLKLYCQYPQGLTKGQWKQLLQYYSQEDFLKLP